MHDGHRDDAHDPAQPDPLRRRGRAPLRDSCPRSPANVHELNQVWTNLIHNALQAMNGMGTTHHRDLARGRLRGRAHHRQRPRHPRGASAGASSTRSSPPRTRATGTGLGLGIASRSSQRHHGQIRVDSEPGRTSFEVLLPTRAGTPRRRAREPRDYIVCVDDEQAVLNQLSGPAHPALRRDASGGVRGVGRGGAGLVPELIARGRRGAARHLRPGHAGHEGRPLPRDRAAGSGRR